MSNGWRRSGPRPSHVDISGNGYAGSILLENHHADVNNDEGVAVSEPGVEASNATRGPNTPNPLPEPARSMDGSKSLDIHHSDLFSLVGESNEVGESSGGQMVEPRWVNDKSHDHMEKYHGAMVENHGENVESHPHNEILWNKITPPNRRNTFGAYNASDPVFLLTGTPFIRNASTSHPQIEKDLEQAREKDKELFEETIEQERKLNEEKFETLKKETNDKHAEALAQLKEQPPTPYSA
ncbi:hypothetical protein Tco_0806010 [Tanacetum coccineum]